MQYPLTCPRCKKKFKLTTPDESKLLKHNFSCDKCGFTTPFVSLLPHLSKYAPRQAAAPRNPGHPATMISQGSGAAASPKTKVSSSQNPAASASDPLQARANALPLYFEVEKTKRRISLAPGEFTLGRDSSDSTASIKVAPDPYMSRQCARLQVKLNDSSVRVAITPLKSRNPIYINDIPVPTGETKCLTLGDKILLGETIIVLKINKK